MFQYIGKIIFSVMINYFSSQSVSSFQGLVKTSNGILCLLPSDGLFLQSKVKWFLIPQSILVFKINFIKEENRSFSFNNFLRTEIRIAVILWFLLPVPLNTIKKPYTFSEIWSYPWVSQSWTKHQWPSVSLNDSHHLLLSFLCPRECWFFVVLQEIENQWTQWTIEW